MCSDLFLLIVTFVLNMKLYVRGWNLARVFNVSNINITDKIGDREERERVWRNNLKKPKILYKTC